MVWVRSVAGRSSRAQSSNPATRPASPPAVSTTASPSCRAWAAIRGCGTKLGHRRQAARVAFGEPRPQVVDAFAGSEGHRVDAARGERLVEAGDARRRRAAVTGDDVDLGPAGTQRLGQLFAPPVAAEDHDPPAAHVGEERQGEQSLAVERRRRNPGVGHAQRRQRLRRSRAGRERGYTGRPRASRRGRRTRPRWRRRTPQSRSARARRARPRAAR